MAPRDPNKLPVLCVPENVLLECGEFAQCLHGFQNKFPVPHVPTKQKGKGTLVIDNPDLQPKPKTKLKIPVDGRISIILDDDPDDSDSDDDTDDNDELDIDDEDKRRDYIKVGNACANGLDEQCHKAIEKLQKSNARRNLYWIWD